jgi:hypothetical protein
LNIVNGIIVHYNPIRKRRQVVDDCTSIGAEFSRKSENVSKDTIVNMNETVYARK